MSDLPESVFANPVWHALQTKHRHLAQSAGGASRYPADVAPFASVSAPHLSALQSLHSLLLPGEYVWLIGESYPPTPGLSFTETLECLQMVLPENITPTIRDFEIISLSCANAPEMVALTDIAFPGFFRTRTCEMGSYHGVRSGGELIAMAGERLIPAGFPEISGVCTHPAHRGKGLAAGLIWHLVRTHRGDGLVSWLHVSATNHHAIELYLRMGFEVARKVTLHRTYRRD